MYTLNTSLQPRFSPTCFNSVISLYANITALNQEEELNEGITDFSVYGLKSSSVKWNLISMHSASHRICYWIHLTTMNLHGQRMIHLWDDCAHRSVSSSANIARLCYKIFLSAELFIFICLNLYLKIFYVIYEKNMIGLWIMDGRIL
jgi:hypothetical protein